MRSVSILIASVGAAVLLCAAAGPPIELDLDAVRKIIRTEFPDFDTTSKIIAFEPTLEESFVEFTVDGPISNLTGLTRLPRGHMKTFHKDPSRWFGASVTVDAGNLSSGSKMGDKKLHRSLEVDRFPEITFTLESFVFEVIDYEGRKGRVRIGGSLDVHGRTLPLELPVEGAFVGGRLITSGAFSVSLSDLRIERPRSPAALFLARSGDEVEIRFRIVWRLVEESLFWTPAELQRYRQ